MSNCDCKTNAAVPVSSVRQQGRDAYFAGTKVGDVPYDEHDERLWEWLQGWAEAGHADIVARSRGRR